MGADNQAFGAFMVGWDAGSHGKRIDNPMPGDLGAAFQRGFDEGWAARRKAFETAGKDLACEDFARVCVDMTPDKSYP